jgi:NADH:ubiquinone oxidoreductase subunit 4 (subunit M)
VPLLVLILVLGLIPSIVLNSTEQGVNQIVRIFGG